MMPRLRAQEALGQVRAGRLAFGTYEQQTASAVFNELQQQAEGMDVADRQERKPPKGELATAGIGVRIVPRKAASPEKTDV